MTAKTTSLKVTFFTLSSVAGVLLLYFIILPELFAGRYDHAEAFSTNATSSVKSLFKKATTTPPVPVFDAKDYEKRMIKLANYASTTATTTPRKWPTSAPAPKAGALLPYHRIVSYYGNFYSKGMGVLGEYPKDVMIQKLQAEVAKWTAADPSIPAMPAIHYIAVTAQGSPQSDGTYRLRMPAEQIQKAIDTGREVKGVTFLDIQVGLSSVQAELPRLEPYLKEKDVHLGLDPEFDMYDGHKPGSVIGTMSAADINYAINFLDKIVTDNNLPPKILVIHRFTEGMVTGTANIKPTPNVQVVMDMDGWGFGAKKLNTYQRVITPYPVQFTGFKLFYKNDLKPPSTRMLTTQEVLSLQPAPIYIQYQ